MILPVFFQCIREALRRADDVFHRPACDYMPAVFARAGPQVNYVVGGAHNRLIVCNSSEIFLFKF